MPETEVNDNGRKKKKIAWKLVENAVAPFLLVILGAVALDPLKNLWTGPSSYKIYLVGKHSSTETQRIFRGFRAEGKISGLTVDDVPIEFEDRDDVSTDAAATAREISDRDDVLMVVGHVFSQRTISALPVYMGANPPIPVIATKETNPDLLSSSTAICSAKGDCPLMQMSPTDDVQARDEVEYAENELKRRMPTKKLSFLVIRQVETDNSRYSDYLAERIAEELRESQKNNKNIEVLPPGAIKGGDDLINYSTLVTSINANSPDCIFLAANPDITKSFLDYAASTITSKPMVFISDGSIQPEVIAEGLGAFDDLYATYQISGVQYRQPESVLGRDAFAIIEKLVWEVGQHRPMSVALGSGYWWRRLLNMHRVGDARRALATQLEKDVRSTQKFSGRSDVIYQFGQPYKRTGDNVAFHIWRIKKNTICDVDGIDANCTTPATQAAPLTSKNLPMLRGRRLDGVSAANDRSRVKEDRLHIALLH